MKNSILEKIFFETNKQLQKLNIPSIINIKNTSKLKESDPVIAFTLSIIMSLIGFLSLIYTVDLLTKIAGLLVIIISIVFFIVSVQLWVFINRREDL